MKARFLTELIVLHISDDIKRLLYPLEYESPLLGRIVTVPAGTETNFASVPRIPFAFWLFGGIADKAAVLHDYAYSGALGISRKMADDLFSEAMRASGVGAIRRRFMYGAVRAFGAAFYREREESSAP